MLFRLVFLALGIYVLRQMWNAPARSHRQIGAGTYQVDNPMFYREGEEPMVAQAGRPETATH